jgi:aminoglycoside 3-N-acetyltransferase
LQDGSGVRTDNPTHSAVVFGNKEITDKLIKDESTAITPTSPNGVYGKLFDFDGYILLVGVGQEKNTYIHAVEEILCIPDRLSELPMKMKVKYKNGEIIERDFHYMTERIGDVSLYFPKYEPAFRKHGAISDGFIGNAKAQLCSARKIKEVVELIRKNSGGIELLADDTPINEKWY